MKIICVQGGDLKPWIERIGMLRIELFREYPYLYDGCLDYEKEYLNYYVEAKRSRVMLVLNENDILVGMSSCLPMVEAQAAFQLPFLNHGYDLEKIGYMGESLLYCQYRGLGIGHHFFEGREKFLVNEWGCQLTAFCAVERESKHPLRPDDYFDLHAFWQKRGYHQHNSLSCELEWKEVDSAKDVTHRLNFWVKSW
jgi:hypothetical protein